MALLNMRDVSVGFGGALVLEGVSLQIERGERVGLLGRNGVGKTTLLRIIAGELAPDEGTIVRQQGLRVASLAQAVPQGLSGAVAEIVAGGLAPTDAGASLATGGEEDAWRQRLQVDTIISRMQLDPAADFALLSAGMKRRVLLARGLVCDPDIVLLDEPTNHLDIDAIAWLEDFLRRYRGTLIFVTHDRAFLRALASRIIEIDRGRLVDWACDYDTFSARKGAVLEAEATQEALFDKKLAQEEAWIRQGIEARRTRNEGRVRALERLRVQRRERRELPGPLRIRFQEVERSGKLVIRAKGVSFSYDPSPGDTSDHRPVVRDFSTTIMRGDKVGIVGPNGSGKTTLLRLLLGDLQPQMGAVDHGTNLEIAYFDQLRAQLDEDRTVLDNVADGLEFITVNGRRRHLIGYLQDFLFTPERARVYAGILSGGERNRLLLARLFARPTNVLVMDEPTNDLDLETLELLEDLLLEYEGTLLMVSHDRELLNNVVSSILALEEDGCVAEYAGGYDDWIRQRPELAGAGRPNAATAADKAASRPAPANPSPDPSSRPDRARGLTYREQREMEALPGQIEALESEQSRLYGLMADPAIYQGGGDEVVRATARLEALERELAEAYKRWEALEAKATPG
ncbi:MAG: ABC transporter ATP-binding protein [Anaerolineae bacterium CG2_30_64_16]|nr:MAG: ABC transporter ATP-binding protein [Anaerolineae bacterium CG2_30_64_16]